MNNHKVDNDDIQITLNRRQIEFLRSLLHDADSVNIREMWNQQTRAEKPGHEYLASYAKTFDKRASTARLLRRKLLKARDQRRKYIDLSDEIFPVFK